MDASTERVWTALRWQEVSWGCCGHVFDLWCGFHMRRWPWCLSRGSGPDQKLALDVHWPKWVFLIRRFQPASCISSCPPNIVGAAGGCAGSPMPTRRLVPD